MKAHPIADELPMLSKADYQDLVDDIKERGLLFPIVVDENDLIIDGRHRFRACEEAGVKVRKVRFIGSDEEKRKHSRSLNDVRRHLSVAERAFRAAKLVNVENGSNQFSSEGGSGEPPITIGSAAKKQNVSRASVKRAKKVIAKGTSELVDAMRSGKVTMLDAEKIADLPQEQQAAAIEKPEVISGEQHDEAQRIHDELQGILKRIRKIERTSEEASRTADSINKFHAAVCSHLCDMSPVVTVSEQKTPVELIEHTCDQFKAAVKELKRIENWDASTERKRAVKTFVKTIRTQVSSFEKYAGIKAGPDKTMFDADADIPEHLNTTEFQEVWNEWWNNPSTKSSRSAVVKKQQLKVLGYGDAEQAVEMLMAAIQGKWQGIQLQYWLPTSFRQNWCGRLPTNADEALLERIDAAASQLSKTGNASGGSKLEKLFDAVVMTVKKVWSPEARNVDDLRAAVMKLCKPEQFETLRETMSKVGINNIYRLQTGSSEWRITRDRFVDTFSSVKKAAG